MKKLAIVLCLIGAEASAGCIGATVMGRCRGTVTDSYGAAQPSYGTSRPTRVSPNTIITPNAYGMGVGSDQYGRPVEHEPLWRGGKSIFAPSGLGNIWTE